jgi:hypothetical protein
VRAYVRAHGEAVQFDERFASGYTVRVSDTPVQPDSWDSPSAIRTRVLSVWKCGTTA